MPPSVLRLLSWGIDLSANLFCPKWFLMPRHLLLQDSKKRDRLQAELSKLLVIGLKNDSLPVLSLGCSSEDYAFNRYGKDLCEVSAPLCSWEQRIDQLLWRVRDRELETRRFSV